MWAVYASLPHKGCGNLFDPYLGGLFKDRLTLTAAAGVVIARR